MSYEEDEFWMQRDYADRVNAEYAENMGLTYLEDTPYPSDEIWDVLEEIQEEGS